MRARSTTRDARRGRTRHARVIALFAVVVLAIAARAGGATTVLPRNSVWKFLATATAPDSTWKDPGFSETGWASGPGVLGFGETYIATPVPFGPDPNHKYRTTYFRTTFALADPPAAITGMTLGANYDDGVVVYLNGAEVARLGIAAGPVSYTTLAVSHEGGVYEPVNLSGAIGALVPGVNLLAVEVHQTSDVSSDLVLDMDLQTTAGLALTRGPYLQSGTSSGLRVRWRTNLASDSHLAFGFAADNLAGSVTDPTLTTEHEVQLVGLSADTRYYYSVGSSTAVLAGGDAAHTFVTAPTPGSPEPTRVWVLGDSGLPGQAQRDVRDAFLGWTGARGLDVWLMLGDNAYTAGTDAEFQAAVFDAYGATLQSTVLWPTRGNHEVLSGGPGNDYYDFFSLPTAGEAGGLPSGDEAYYSFDHGDIHFVCLDSEGSDRSLAGDMLRWLRNDLAANDRTWTIAYWHHPPYTKGSHDSDNDADSGGRMRDMRMNALPILDSAGVDLVLTGHSHSYERSFLLNGHYGTSNTLTPAMIVDGGDGRIGGDGPYVKPTAGAGPFEGVVYTVAGSSSQTATGALDHPVMVTSLEALGSLVLDVVGTRLDAHFLSSTGALLDSFTVMKGGALPVEPGTGGALRLRLAVAGANPSAAETRLAFTLPRAGPTRLTIVDVGGRRMATLLDGVGEAGEQRAVWRSAGGRRAHPGVYFAVLEFEGERRVVKIVRER